MSALTLPSSARAAPALQGNAALRQLALGGLNVSEVRFPAGLFLPSHFHETACLTVMLEGGLRERFPGRTLDCVPGSVLAKPWLERHDDLFSRAGSRQVLIELSTDRADDLEEARTLLATVALLPANGARAIADRIAREFAHPDGATRLAVESYALELMALLVRGQARGERRCPPWLAAARDTIHDDLWSEHSARALAATAGVHPGYFARQFRRHFGRSVGAYVRLARLEWAAQQLRSSRRPLSELAHVAGFADHSHFTREFKRQFGVPPRTYRERYS